MIGKRICLIGLALSVLAGCQSAPSQQDLQLADVASMEKVNNYDGLISYYKAELAQGSEDPELKEKLAWAYFHKGDIESADFYVQHLQKEGFENPNLYQLEGQVFNIEVNCVDILSIYICPIQFCFYLRHFVAFRYFIFVLANVTDIVISFFSPPYVCNL